MTQVLFQIFLVFNLALFFKRNGKYSEPGLL